MPDALQAHQQATTDGARLVLSEDGPEDAQATGRWLATTRPVEVRA